MGLSPEIAIFAGTFDPLTMGHVSLVRRGRTIFPIVIVGVAKDTHKQPLFTFEERVAMAREVFSDDDGVVVEGFEGLLVDYACRRGAKVLLRGLRAVSDFEYEFQMALMNRRLQRQVQTMFLMTDYKWMYLSSSIIKEAAKHGGNIKNLVPDHVLPKVYSRLVGKVPENLPEPVDLSATEE